MSTFTLNPTVSSNPVPLVNLISLPARMQAEITEVVNRIIETGAFINGPDCEAFEREFADYCGVKGAVGCASGTDCLQLILRALEIGPGDGVITAADWIILSETSGTTPTSITVEVVSGLAPGTYTDSISIGSTAGTTSLIVPVTYQVGPVGGGSAGLVGPTGTSSPTALARKGHTAQPQPKTMETAASAPSPSRSAPTAPTWPVAIAAAGLVGLFHRRLRVLFTLLVLVMLPTVSLAQAPPPGQIVEYFHTDALGNVIAVSNASGAEIESHDYLPFGEECLTGPCASNTQPSAGQSRKFTGKERDRDTGLDYFGARYYGSKMGRFTTIDPVYTWRENLVDPQRWNRYAYVRNNPLRYVDPDGREIAMAADATKGDRQFLTNALTEVAMRPGGREYLNALIESSSTTVFGVGSVNDPANVEAARKGQSVGLTFGTTTFLDPTTNQITVTIDRRALREFAARTKPGLDSSGVTTTAHEIYHARDALSGRPQQFAAGDRPTSATGPAERFGQATRREKKDQSRSEARRTVTEALERKQQ